jgi:hypothetical protein
MMNFSSVDGITVNPVGEELGDFLAFPLRSHMSSAMNGSKVKGSNITLVVDEVARYLVVSVP